MKHFGLAALMLTLTCVLCAPAVAAEQKPHGLVMAADLVLARPIGILITTVGAASFVVFLPFTAASGDVKTSAKALVVDPARQTFVRCLGCPAGR
jgi:hypothetical protein